MNHKEYQRLVDAITLVLKRATVDSFRFNLLRVTNLSEVNLPRRKWFTTIDDILTLNNVCNEVGQWVISEIESDLVQFSKLSTVDYQGKEISQETPELLTRMDAFRASSSDQEES